MGQPQLVVAAARVQAASTSPEVPLLRVVCWQLALVTAGLAVVAGLERHWPATITLGAAGALVASLSALRIRGRWLSTALMVRMRYLSRTREHDVGDDPAALLSLLAPGARLHSAEFGAVLSHPTEMVALLRPHEVVTVGTVVLHASPGRAEPVRTWLALRAARDVDSHTDEELTAVLANTVRRTRRQLARDGIATDLLSEKDVLDMLVALTHTGSGRGEITEHWRYWRTGPVIQACFRVRGTTNHQTMHRLLSAAPDVAITAAVSADGHAMLRIASITLATTNDAATELSYLGRRLGVRLERLDGGHAPAVAATLPIGGTR